MALQFHRDKEGVARAAWTGDDAAGNLLARFFEADLGADVSYCDRLLAEAEKHLHGHARSWKTSGNAFALEIEGSKVNLRPLFGADQDRSFTIEAQEFLELLRKWRALFG